MSTNREEIRIEIEQMLSDLDDIDLDSVEQGFFEIATDRFERTDSLYEDQYEQLKALHKQHCLPLLKRS